MAGYTRQDTSDNIADTKTIDAADLDAEFDAVEAAFNNSTGHTHDGTAAEGAPIEVTGPNQEYLSEAAQFRPKTDDTYDLGSATFQWKDLYVDGTANIDSLVADTADIDGGTVDNAVIGGVTPAAGSFTTVSATGNITVGGTVDGRDVAADGTKLDGIETNADVTDTANVTAAGALMDSELTNIAAVKALDQGVATTDSPTFAGLTLSGTLDFDSGVFTQGSVTPTITGSTGAPSAVTYSGQTGRYIQVGNLMFVHLFLGVTSITGGSGIGVIEGLPGSPTFTTAYSANVGFAIGHGSVVVKTALFSNFTQASGGITLYDDTSTAINLSDYASSQVYISLFYEV